MAPVEGKNQLEGAYEEYLHAHSKLRKKAYESLSDAESSEVKRRFLNARTEYRILVRAIKDRAYWLHEVRAIKRTWHWGRALFIVTLIITALVLEIGYEAQNLVAVLLIIGTFGLTYLVHLLSIFEARSYLRTLNDLVFAQTERVAAIAPKIVQGLGYFELAGIYEYEESNDLRLLEPDFFVGRKVKVDRSRGGKLMDELGLSSDNWGDDSLYVSPSELIDLKIELASMDLETVLAAVPSDTEGEYFFEDSDGLVLFRWDYPAFLKYYSGKFLDK
jgi:hypothetical protein